MKISQELLDVVDENDLIIGVKTRGEIHARRLMHRATHILVFNRQGKLFIQKRSMSKDNDPGLWDTSSSGHDDSGEDYYSCSVRELHEELGIVVDSPLETLFRLAPTTITGMEHCTVYRCTHDGPFELQADEIDEGKWVSARDMDRRVSEADPTVTTALQLIWKKIRGWN